MNIKFPQSVIDSLKEKIPNSTKVLNEFMGTLGLDEQSPEDRQRFQSLMIMMLVEDSLQRMEKDEKTSQFINELYETTQQINTLTNHIKN